MADRKPRGMGGAAQSPAVFPWSSPPRALVHHARKRYCSWRTQILSQIDDKVSPVRIAKRAPSWSTSESDTIMAITAQSVNQPAQSTAGDRALPLLETNNVGRESMGPIVPQCRGVCRFVAAGLASVVAPWPRGGLLPVYGRVRAAGNGRMSMLKPPR